MKVVADDAVYELSVLQLELEIREGVEQRMSLVQRRMLEYHVGGGENSPGLQGRYVQGLGVSMSLALDRVEFENNNTDNTHQTSVSRGLGDRDATCSNARMAVFIRWLAPENSVVLKSVPASRLEMHGTHPHLQAARLGLQCRMVVWL